MAHNRVENQKLGLASDKVEYSLRVGISVFSEIFGLNHSVVIFFGKRLFPRSNNGECSCLRSHAVITLVRGRCERVNGHWVAVVEPKRDCGLKLRPCSVPFVVNHDVGNLGITAASWGAHEIWVN